MPPAAVDFGNHHVVPAAANTTPPPAMVSENFAKDAILAWFRGEFTAANAIIDALCNHITQLEGATSSEYESVFAAIHRRRLNWIPILQMQKYCSIAEVTLELRKVADKRGDVIIDAKRSDTEVDGSVADVAISYGGMEKSVESPENGGSEVVDENSLRDDSHGSHESEITDTGSQRQPFLESAEFCSNHEICETRHAHIKMTKGFVSKEPVKGNMVNVLRGLKLYEDVFTPNEISKLNDFVNELRVAGQNGELSGETFILYNQLVKGNRRELLQLGTPIFGHNQKSNIEPIPILLQGVIDHLIQWRLISDSRRPNSCIVNFFDEGEYSQPFLKPPHLEQPVTTLLLSESMMAFGRTLASDSNGNYKGSFVFSLKEGSLLVMRGNSADMARHALCSSANNRVAITFFKVRTEMGNFFSDVPPLTRTMTLWQPGVPTQFSTANGASKWGFFQAPEVMLASMSPVVRNPQRIPHGGTGVFLPLSRKPAKQLPPRAQKRRFLELPSPGD